MTLLNVFNFQASDLRWYFVYGDFQLQNFVIDADGFVGIVDAKDIGLVDLDQHPPRQYHPALFDNKLIIISSWINSCPHYVFHIIQRSRQMGILKKCQARAFAIQSVLHSSPNKYPILLYLRLRGHANLSVRQ